MKYDIAKIAGKYFTTSITDVIYVIMIITTTHVTTVIAVVKYFAVTTVTSYFTLCAPLPCCLMHPTPAWRVLSFLPIVFLHSTLSTNTVFFASGKSGLTPAAVFFFSFFFSGPMSPAAGAAKGEGEDKDLLDVTTMRTTP